MSKEDLARLFKPFSQVNSSISRRFGGTGLGLYISNKIVELLGGQIKVESELGKGTKFSFDLTFNSMDSGFASPRSMPSPVLKRRETLWGCLSVLLVEDNPINQKVAVRLLQKLGVTPDIASDGFECLEMAKKKYYHLIFMDISMPGKFIFIV